MNTPAEQKRGLLREAILRLMQATPPGQQQVEYVRWQDRNFKVVERRPDGKLLLKVGHRGDEIRTVEVHESETVSTAADLYVGKTARCTNLGMSCGRR